MKGAETNRIALIPGQMIKPLLHLRSRRFRKCDYQNIRRIHATLFDQISGPMGDYRSLSRSRRRDNKARTLEMPYRLHLARIQGRFLIIFFLIIIFLIIIF